MSGYGSGSVTKHRDKWRVRIPDGKGGKLTVGSYPDKGTAERMRDAALLSRPELGLGPCPTLADYGTRWLDRCELAGHRAMDSARSNWARVVNTAPFADWPLDVVTRGDVQGWVNRLRVTKSKRGGTYSQQSAKHALGALHRCLETARLEDMLITENPAKSVKLWGDAREDDPWTWLRLHEIESIRTSPMLTELQRSAFLFVAHTGLRQGEAFGLRWEDVELSARRMRVSRSWDGPTKGGKPRTVDLIPTALEILVVQHERLGRPKTGFVFGREIYRKKVLVGVRMYSEGYDAGWADTYEKGRKAPYCRLGARRLAGITRHVRFHDLRHTYASHLVQGSWGRVWRLEEIREVLGHSKVETTERYAHLCADGLAAAAAATVQQDPNRTQVAAAKAAETTVFQGAGDLGVEPRTFGSGVPRHGNDSANLEPTSPVRVLSDSEALLERVAEGLVTEGEIKALGESVLGLEMVRRAHGVVEGSASDPGRVRAAVELARSVGETLPPAKKAGREKRAT